jgi:hypothetical protein
MQNNVIVLCLALILRLFRSCLKQVGGMFVLRRTHAGRIGLGAFSLSVDLDSARLDVVSRSLLWGSGIPIPERAPAARYSAVAAMRRDARVRDWRRDVPPPRHMS